MQMLYVNFPSLYHILSCCLWLAVSGWPFLAFLSCFVYISFVYKKERRLGDLRSMF